MTRSEKRNGSSPDRYVDLVSLKTITHDDHWRWSSVDDRIGVFRTNSKGKNRFGWLEIQIHSESVNKNENSMYISLNQMDFDKWWPIELMYWYLSDRERIDWIPFEWPKSRGRFLVFSLRFFVDKFKWFWFYSINVELLKLIDRRILFLIIIWTY